MLEAKVEIFVTQNGKRAPQFDLVNAASKDLDGRLTLVDLLSLVKTTLIITSDTALKEEQARGFDKNPVIAVDGSVGKPVIDVKPLGTIEITARAHMSEIILATYQGLLDRSPVLEGVYKASHYVFWNGNQVATNLSSLNTWLASNPNFNDKDFVRFVNIQPYARKLERLGVTGQRTKTRSTSRKDKRSGQKVTKVNQPNGDYYLTARSIRSKYKRNSTIKFEFISGSQLGLKASFVPKKGKPGRAYVYPSILISVQESGTL